MTLLKFKNETPSRSGHVFPTVNDFFTELFDGINVNDSKRWNSPAVNIIESDGEFKLQLAAPGLSKEDFKININDNLLVVSAEKKSENTSSTQRYSRKEFSFNSFTRSFTLPDLIKVEHINATYDNGIMSIVLPKAEAAKPKVHEVKIG